MPPVPLTCKVQLLGTYGTTNWANVFYVRYTTPDPTVTAVTALATAINSQWFLYMKSMHAVALVLNSVNVIDLNDVEGNQGSAVSGTAGTKAGDSLPANIAMCATKVIARRYRGGHPRMYLPAMVWADTLDQRNWKGSTVTAVQGSLNSFLSGINGSAPAGMGAVEMVNVSFWYSPVKGQPPVLRAAPIVDKIMSFKVDSRIDSQRRRLD